jgi:hypothetical protein
VAPPWTVSASFYNVLLQPPDEFGCAGGTAFNWAWNGEYDISSMGEDAPTFAAGICDDLIYSCWDTCDSTAFKAWAVNRVNEQVFPTCQYEIECIEGWANPSCQQGETGSFTCSCQYMNVCAPC